MRFIRVSNKGIVANRGRSDPRTWEPVVLVTGPNLEEPIGAHIVEIRHNGETVALVRYGHGGSEDVGKRHGWSAWIETEAELVCTRADDPSPVILQSQKREVK